jgi:hypothetical protein
MDHEREPLVDSVIGHHGFGDRPRETYPLGIYPKSTQLMRLIGRPPISEKTLRFLREGYDAGFTTTQAAEMALVHRNTAINYYRHFRMADELERQAINRLREYSRTMTAQPEDTSVNPS